MSKRFVAILMGSKSDLETMQATVDVLNKLDVRFEMHILSAHRTPAQTHDYVKDADARGCGTFIAAAGLAAHLAGAVAAATVRPVIGVPMIGALDGLDSLLSTVQMPGGVPVACVALGRHGAKNAGYLAAQILSLEDAELAKRVADERAQATEAVLADDAALQAKLGGNA